MALLMLYINDALIAIAVTCFYLQLKQDKQSKIISSLL